MFTAGTRLPVTVLSVGRPRISAAMKSGLEDVGAAVKSLPPGFSVVSDLAGFVGLDTLFGFWVAETEGDSVGSAELFDRVASGVTAEPVGKAIAVGVESPLGLQAYRMTLPIPRVAYLIKLRRDKFDMLISFFVEKAANSKVMRVLHTLITFKLSLLQGTAGQ